MGIQPEIREETRGKPVQRLALSSVVQKAFYTFDKTWRSTQSYAALAAQTLIKTRLFSLHTWVYTQVLGNLHNLPAKRAN